MYNRIIKIVADILFPRRCPVCDEIVLPRGGLICPECVKSLSFVKGPVCKKCGKEVFSDRLEYCFDCTKHTRSFESGRALINYNDAAKDSMVKIKYKNKREYIDFYTEAICRRYEKQITRMRADVLVPVPVHPSRMKTRGYNQAELLARGIGRSLGIPVRSDLLRRSRKTAPQKELNPAERLKNLEQAFEAEGNFAGIETVILIDDIYTTGSTIEACTRALKRAGVKTVYFLTICIGRGQ